MKPLCIYNGNCADGFTAGWVVRKALGNAVDFHPGVYQNPPPDVKGRDVLLVDDMVSTGGSIVDAARIVKQKGANSVFIIATHAVLAGKAVERLNAADVEKILFADTIPLPDSKIARLETVSIAQLLARAIDRIHRSESVSKLFEPES